MKKKTLKNSVREGYVLEGVDGYYLSHSETYSNPHFLIIKEIIEKERIKGSVLDLCCGSGEVSKVLKGCFIIGSDPYTYNLYKKNTGYSCYSFSFLDIAQGKLSSENIYFDYIICSFALHLCPVSLLPMVLYELSRVSEKLIILSPHKRPYIKEYWVLKRSYVYKRVHFREYVKKYT